MQAPKGIPLCRLVGRGGTTESGLPLQVVHQNGKVGGREGVAAEPVDGHPGKGDMFDRRGFRAARREAGDKGRHLDADCLVDMPPGGQRVHEEERAPELFLNFSGEGMGRRFPSLDLAARKLPGQAEVFVRRSLGDQNRPLFFDQHANDGNGGRRRHPEVLTEKAKRTQPIVVRRDGLRHGLRRWREVGMMCEFGLWDARRGLEGQPYAGADFATRFLQLSLTLRCAPTMKTFVKILLIAAIVLLAFKLWPIALVLAGAIGWLLVSVSGVLVGGIAAVLAVAVGAVVLLLSVGVSAAVVLSPLWITALVVIGAVALVRKAGARARA